MSPSASRLRGASTAVLVACALAVSGCGNDPVLNADDGQPGPVDVSAISVGSSVTAFATVTDVLTVESFLLTGARVDGGQLLVAAPEATPLRTGVRVTVRGTLEVFDEAARNRLGLEPSDRFAPYLGQKYLLASSVDGPVQGEVID